MKNEITRGRKAIIVDRFTSAGALIGLLLGIIGIAQAISDGAPTRHLMLLLGIITGMGGGAGWLVGNVVAWMLAVEEPKSGN